MFFFIIILIFLLAFFKKKQSKNIFHKQLKNHPDFFRLIQTEYFLDRLYSDVNSKEISISDRKKLNLIDDDFIYGEIHYLPFFGLLEKANLKSNEIFYDLGSGSGKAVFCAAFFFDIQKACGIEFLPALYDLSILQIKKSYQLIFNQFKHKIQEYHHRVSKIYFFKDDFMQHDFFDGDVFFVNATCINYFKWERLVKSLKKIKSGSRLILTTKKIISDDFVLLSESRELMSWGFCAVHIYIKK